MGQGFVYVMANESMPGLLKIGKTSRHPNERLKDYEAQVFLCRFG